MKLGWIEISFKWHGPGSRSEERKLTLDARIREAYHHPESHGFTSGGRLVSAIKEYRANVPGSGMIEAKQYCENLLGIPSPAALDAQLRLVYGNGNGFINAIKRHRELTGSSLKEAKDYCDRLFKRGPYSAYAEE